MADGKRVKAANRFEDLLAWQKARELTRAIYEQTRHQPFSSDRGLTSQMQRAAVSVMSNIAEGCDRGSDADFYRFLVIAKASCAELRSQLYVAYDVGYLDEPCFAKLKEQAVEVSRIIGGLAARVAKDR